MTKKEIRIQLGSCELRDSGSGGSKRLSGYAAKFGVLSENLGGFREKIAPGAFADSIRTADVRLLINHEGLPLARTKSGTLKLSEDHAGLRFHAELDGSDPDVARIVPKMQRGDLNQMSFGFYTKRESWNRDDPKNAVRTLLEVELFDVSLVTFPAYPQTGAGIRSPQEIYRDFINASPALPASVIDAQSKLRRHQLDMWKEPTRAMQKWEVEARLREHWLRMTKGRDV